MLIILPTTFSLWFWFSPSSIVTNVYFHQFILYYLGLSMCYAKRPGVGFSRYPRFLDNLGEAKRVRMRMWFLFCASIIRLWSHPFNCLMSWHFRFVPFIPSAWIVSGQLDLILVCGPTVPLRYAISWKFLLIWSFPSRTSVALLCLGLDDAASFSELLFSFLIFLNLIFLSLCLAFPVLWASAIRHKPRR